jgi:hypothetical protein
MAVTVTREMMNQYSSATAGGTTVPDLFIRDVDEFIPFIKDVNADFIKKIPTKGTVNKLKYEWGDGDLTPTEVKATSTVNSSALAFDVDFSKYVQQYDVILNVNTGEQLRVTAEPTTASLTVVRGHGGSTPAAVTTGNTFRILGPAVPEGADTPNSPSSQGSLDFNYPQIFEYSWAYTHRGRVTPTYEVKSDRFKHEMKLKMQEAARDLNRTAIFGLRSQGNGSGTPSTTGGARQFAKAHVTDLTGNPIELNHLLDLLQNQYEDVGSSSMSKEMWMTPTTKRILNSFLNPIRMANVSDAKLNMTLDSIETDFGTITMKTDTEFLNGEIFTFNFSDLGRYAYEGGNWVTGLMSTEGWYDRGFLRGDFGFKWPAPRRRGAILGISTDKTDYPNYDVQGLHLSPTNVINIEP